jgi:hypothetical protein
MVMELPHDATPVPPVPCWPAKTSPAEESSRQAPIVMDDMRYFISGFLLSIL